MLRSIIDYFLYIRYAFLITFTKDSCMENNQRKRFGTIAVEKGYITDKEVIEALEIQREEKLKKGKHRLLGQILVDRGCITEAQITEVLDYMDQQLVFMLSVGR